MSKWLVKIQGYEYETNIDELKQWVIEGRVLPEDMIFRQGLGWRIAREVPMLREAFEEQRKSLHRNRRHLYLHPFTNLMPTNKQISTPFLHFSREEWDSF